jgi:hypothetical protein
MTEENEIVASVKTVVNHPIYAAFTKGEIPKLAYKKLELSHIAKLNGLKLENIFKGHAHEFWLAHLDKILRHHRSEHGTTYLPTPLPNGVRQMTAEMLTKKNEKKVDELFLKLKNKHQKLESEIKSTVRRRV